MKTAWLRKEGAEELLVFFNGWGMDHRIAAWLLRESLSAGFSLDMLACYDYHTLETEEGFMNAIHRYSRITVVAWSFGVWAAQHTELPPIGRAIAINGTLHPVDARVGFRQSSFRQRFQPTPTKIATVSTAGCAAPVKLLSCFPAWRRNAKPWIS